MIAYLDSSVLLRVVLGQRDALKEWGRVTQGIVSALAEVECLRTLDRLRSAQGFANEVIAEQREAVYRLLEAMEIVEITYPVLSRAAHHFRRHWERWTRFILLPRCCGRIKREKTCRWRLTTWHWPSPRAQAGCALSERSGWHQCRGGKGGATAVAHSASQSEYLKRQPSSRPNGHNARTLVHYPQRSPTPM